jgi:Kef-type K+ transport system membrane component KefB
VATRLIQLAVLVAVYVMLFGTTRVARDSHGALDTIAATGFLLLAGTLAADVLEPIGLPHLTGYLAAGMIAGPHILHLIDHETVENLSQVNSLALALIALAGGAELKLDLLKKLVRSLAVHQAVQSTFVLVMMTITFYSARSLMPFTAGMSVVMVVAIGLLWATLAVTRSPAALLAVLAQTRAKGPVATFNLAFILSSDVVVVVLLAGVISIAKPMLAPGTAFSVVHTFKEAGHELLGSIALGTTLGLILALYCKFVGRQLLLVLIALGFGMSEMLRYLRFEALLTFMVAGFVVTNLSSQGDKLLHAIEKAAGVVFVVFFATAGAHLDIPLLKKLWIVALLLAGTRILFTFIAHAIGTRLAGDPPPVRRWGWAGLVSQAGLALGVAAVIERSFPAFGAAFRSLSLANIAINEIIGPVLFKLSLDRTGETSHAPEELRSDTEVEGETEAPA